VSESASKEDAARTDVDTTETATQTAKRTTTVNKPAKEFGGPNGLEPTRFGDWEKNGRCSDF